MKINGWRLVITDAAAGSRFYVMEKTMDGGSTWECINDDPFSGQLGVAEGLIFYDETLGLQELQAHPSPIPAYMSLAMAEGPLKK